MTNTFTHYSFENGGIHFNVNKDNNPQRKNWQETDIN